MVCSPLVVPEGLRLAGVRLGVASHHVPREGIVDVTFSPIVHNYRSTPESGPQFFDISGKETTLAEVVDSVIHADALCMLKAERASKFPTAGSLAVALYGRELGRRFAYLQSYDRFVGAFGKPDRVVEDEAYGELLAHDHYDFAIRKHARWSPISRTLDLVHGGVLRYPLE